jgi:hypothetical protein
VPTSAELNSHSQWVDTNDGFSCKEQKTVTKIGMERGRKKEEGQTY